MRLASNIIKINILLICELFLQITNSEIAIIIALSSTVSCHQLKCNFRNVTVIDYDETFAHRYICEAENLDTIQ